MASLARFLRCIRLDDLKRHLAILDDALGEAFPETTPLNVAWLHGHLSNAQYDRLVAEAERVAAMTDEVGQTAMLALPYLPIQLASIDGAYNRAYALFLADRKQFRRAEEIRYADENQNAQRLWDAFVGPVGCGSTIGADRLNAFKEKLRPILSKDRIHIDEFERSRQEADGSMAGVIQVTIYSEDVPEDEIVFNEEELLNRTRKPVRETTIIYEPDTGTIEIVARQRRAREEIATLFASIVLGNEIKGERLPRRRIDLFPLLDVHTFPTLPGDGIARVKLTRLVCSTNDDRLLQMFQVPFKDETSLYDVVKDQYGDDNPLDGDLNPWSARIEVQFEPEPDAKTGKKIAFTLTHPNKCSLRGKTARERQILSGHLRAWGLTER